jgi:hypothetical protein
MRYKKYLFLVIVLLITIILSVPLQEKKYATSYWLWAGITAQDAPENAEFYVYQGLINTINNTTTYNRIGLYPHPIKSKKLFLAYRLEGDLPNAKEIISIFKDNILKWQRHSLTVNGLQLDFDSPTSKLLIYSNFLKEVRKQLPKQYALSITGLGDWAIYGNKKAMQSIAKVTDEIVFQLYQGWHPLPNIEDYIRALKNYPMPFRVGFLSRYPSDNYIAIFKKNHNFNGVIYFIQKTI